MITINYTKDGMIFSDFEMESIAEIIVDYIKKGKDEVFEVSSELLIHAIRVFIKEGKININDIEIQFNGEKIPFDKNGRSDYWPDGFCDTNEKLLMRLL